MSSHDSNLYLPLKVHSSFEGLTRPSDEGDLYVWFFTVKLFLVNYFKMFCKSFSGDCQMLGYKLYESKKQFHSFETTMLLETMRLGCENGLDIIHNITARHFCLAVRDFIFSSGLIDAMLASNLLYIFGEECLYTSTLLIAAKYLEETFDLSITSNVYDCIEKFKRMVVRAPYLYSKKIREILKTISFDGDEIVFPEQSPESKAVALKVIQSNLGKISSGTFGRVVDVGSGYCSKLPKHTNAVPDVIHEINFLRKYSHENIIEMEDVIISNSLIGFSMKKYDHCLLNVGRLIADEAMIILEQILKALKYLNQNGLAHLDLKTNNVVVNMKPRPQVKIIDFGSVRKIGDYFSEGYGPGTYSYLAPEGFGDFFVTELIDIWAAGCILYDLIVGVSVVEVYSYTFEEVREFTTEFVACDKFKNSTIVWSNGEKILLPDIIKHMLTKKDCRKTATQLLEDF